MNLVLRHADTDDAAAIWEILRPIARGGEHLCLPRDIDRAAAEAYWFAPGHSVFVAEADGRVLGSYWIAANQSGGGAHVANAAYATAPGAQGRGVARAMLEHSLDTAQALGFRAMQFNIVVATNLRAIDLWRSGGFEVVGRLPGAFLHPTEGYVDALVMFRRL
jgi:GNAT superfamily N-acetyltransferase